MVSSCPLITPVRLCFKGVDFVVAAMLRCVHQW